MRRPWPIGGRGAFATKEKKFHVTESFYVIKGL
jgi:hypothetical protein